MNEVRTKADQILKKGKSRMPAMDLSFLDFFSAHTALKTSRPHKFKTINPNFFSKKSFAMSIILLHFFRTIILVIGIYKHRK